uniref:diguanylate cyclase n=1 Tax=Candidatus Kentrum sp. LPFa TaxID=2126335 RepID=A0A450X8H2_9GAMM|nr:MAG: diguanylate cyclase (GGDEF) domain-containing protein [Candidatus Kentron sp. LPFa]VFK35967.1 MAG: diguanylate cyclase (GGDEF) domain-containing protein [Candidatus Kentron sp. LPFa]
MGTYFVLRIKLNLGKMDMMTNTLREAQINPFLEKRIEVARNANTLFGVLLVDIDNFKKINSDYNHEVGNNILCELAEIIRPRSKGEEIFRYGGDEFLIVINIDQDEVNITNQNERNCWGYAGRILREVRSHSFPGDINSSDISLNVSCGCLVTDGKENVRALHEPSLARQSNGSRKM